MKIVSKKDPSRIGTVINKQVYTIPSFTNLYGQKVDANPCTIKIYNPDSSFENGGVMPEALLKVVLIHYKQKDTLTKEEGEIKQVLEMLLNK